MATPEVSQQDHAYLAEVVAMAKRNEGLTLPTVGSAGLAEVARMLGTQADRLAKIAKRAVAKAAVRLYPPLS